MKGPMKWCAIPFLLVQVMSGGAKADFTSGNDLRDWCQANDPMKDALCTSYVLGAGETFQVLQVAKQVRFYCIPDKVQSLPPVGRDLHVPPKRRRAGRSDL